VILDGLMNKIKQLKRCIFKNEKHFTEKKIKIFDVTFFEGFIF